MRKSRRSRRTSGKAHGITSWKPYNEALLFRDMVKLWFEEEILGWEHLNAERKVDVPFTYSARHSIACCRCVRCSISSCHLCRWLARVMKAKAENRDSTMLLKRVTTLEIALSVKPTNGLLDSTGLKARAIRRHGHKAWKGGASCRVRSLIETTVSTLKVTCATSSTAAPQSTIGRSYAAPCSSDLPSSACLCSRGANR